MSCRSRSLRARPTAPAERDSASISYNEFDRTSNKLVETIRAIAGNPVHLARLLQKQPYPVP